MLAKFIFPKNTARVRDGLLNLVGREAAQQIGECSSLRMLASCLALATIALSGWAVAVGGGVPRILAVLCSLAFLFIAIAGINRSRGVTAAAQAFISQTYGLDLHGYTGGPSPSSWQRNIDRARKNGWTTH